MYGSDFLFEYRGDGTSDLVWAQPRFRATWLSFLGASYSYLTTTAAGVFDPSGSAMPGVAQFHESMRSIIENTALRRRSLAPSIGEPPLAHQQLVRCGICQPR